MEENKEIICPKCGKKISKEDKFCGNCGHSAVKSPQIKINKITYYDKLKSTGDTVFTLSVVLGIIMILGFLVALMDNGPAFLIFVSTIVTFITGSAINKLFFCIAEMAKNLERQTELLEKLDK